MNAQGVKREMQSSFIKIDYFYTTLTITIQVIMSDETWYIYSCTNQGIGFHCSAKPLIVGVSYEDVWGWLRDDQNEGHKEEPDKCMTFEQALDCEWFIEPSQNEIDDLINGNIDEIVIHRHEHTGYGLLFITTIETLVIKNKKINIIDFEGNLMYEDPDTTDAYKERLKSEQMI